MVPPLRATSSSLGLLEWEYVLAIALVSIGMDVVTGYAGRITLGSRRLDGAPAHMVARWGIARTFQTPKLVPRGTALDNVLLGADRLAPCSDIDAVFRTRRGRAAGQMATEYALACLEMVGGGAYAEVRAGELPHGTQRLVEVARGIASTARYLLLDEPMAGLSTGEGEALEQTLRACTRLGLAIVVIEHNVPFVLRVAERITVLENVRVLAEGTPEELAADTGVAQRPVVRDVT